MDQSMETAICWNPSRSASLKIVVTENVEHHKLDRIFCALLSEHENTNWVIRRWIYHYEVVFSPTISKLFKILSVSSWICCWWTSCTWKPLHKLAAPWWRIIWDKDLNTVNSFRLSDCTHISLQLFRIISELSNWGNPKLRYNSVQQQISQTAI